MTDKTIAKKEKALELLKEMDIYKPYIRGFHESDKVCFFENFGGFWLHQEPEIDRKRQEIEAKYNCLVYAVTHEFTQFGELYDFLIVTDYPEEWDTLIYSQGNRQHPTDAKVKKLPQTPSEKVANPVCYCVCY